MALAQETWVLTGAGGRIGGALRRRLAERVGRLRLVDLAAVASRHPGEEARVADLRDPEAVQAAIDGAHGVVHLGGLADEADFHDLEQVNVAGTYHVLEAARRTGAGRVVLASTNHVTGLYASGEPVSVEQPPRPDSLYGVSKVADEALGRMYAEKLGLRVACVRIGSFEPAPTQPRHLSTWLSPRDALAAFLAAMTAPDLTYAAFYGVSRNTRGWWDLEAGRRLGFEPVDDAEEHAAAVEAGASTTVDGPQGGTFATADYTLDRQRR
jgi:uronate dehydrogenase